MRTLAFLSVLQSFTTGAYVAACSESNANALDWFFAALLVFASGLFACYVVAEGGRSARR
jgi:hypothetical protein